jgi:magnesium transporter
MEDVLNTYQRPKMEEHKDHLFIASRMFLQNKEYILKNEQLSMFLGKHFVLTMQENELDFFEPVRYRLNHGKGYIRQNGVDYMAYALLDAIVDNYFPLLESMGEKLDELEDELFLKPARVSLQKIQLIKRELILFRRTIFAERDKINDVLRTESALVKDSTKVFLRDTYDHTIQVMDLVESYKEITASLMEIYLSSVSNRMNQIMKVLAVISTIFIPLTFIVGVYGMNFSAIDPYTGQKYPLNMPELHSPYGYVGIMLFMVMVVLFQLFIFYRRGWLSKT